MLAHLWADKDARPGKSRPEIDCTVLHRTRSMDTVIASQGGPRDPNLALPSSTSLPSAEYKTTASYQHSRLEEQL